MFILSVAYVRFFIFSHSMFDVGRSMFDVHPLFEQPFFQVI